MQISEQYKSFFRQNRMLKLTVITQNPKVLEYISCKNILSISIIPLRRIVNIYFILFFSICLFVLSDACKNIFKAYRSVKFKCSGGKSVLFLSKVHSVLQ